MEPLRRWLARRGFAARHWGFGVNGGQPEVDADRLARVVDARAAAIGRPIGLVGWSLGGVIAREVAREVPHAVSSVVTYGTPVIGGPTYTIAATAWPPEKRAYIARKIASMDERRPIARPIRAVFTRRDGIVAWPACLDRASTDVVHFEADSGHFGMGIDPDVWRLAADTLDAHAR
jgi:pimeloyl-ACP methyl ester carboxylesterase